MLHISDMGLLLEKFAFANAAPMVLAWYSANDLFVFQESKPLSELILYAITMSIY